MKRRALSRISLFSIVCVCAVGRIPAQSSETERIIPAGSLFTHYNCPFLWTTPVALRVKITPRGTFSVCELTPVSGDAFFADTGAFKIRRPGRILDLSLLVRCGDFAVPPGDEFATEASCTGNSGGNELIRRAKIVRKKDILYIFYIAARTDQRTGADALLESVTLNPSFHIPTAP